MNTIRDDKRKKRKAEKLSKTYRRVTANKIITVNLPPNKKCYSSGHGEGCLVAVNSGTYKLWYFDYKGGSFKGKILHDSLYYPSIRKGQTILFEMRGNKRPVAFLDKLPTVAKQYADY